jgi:hypothetical protein
VANAGETSIGINTINPAIHLNFIVRFSLIFLAHFKPLAGSAKV